MKRVLIVDDEEDILLGLSRYLKKHGYEVIGETSPKKALELLSVEPTDILITDIKMDEMSGLDLIVEARKKNPDIKIIVMTARGSDEIERITFEKGAVEYIEKPFDMDYLVELLSKVEKGGFKGVVRELSITDVLNILNVERANAVINIVSARGNGRIYIEDGEIVHAEFADLEGMEALKAIVSLEGGSFSVKRGVLPEKHTIDMSFNNLMLEIFAKIDEEKAEFEVQEDTDWSIFSSIVEEEEEQKVELSENLLKEIENLILSDEKVVSFGIYDVSGKAIYEKDMDISLSELVKALSGVSFVESFTELSDRTLAYVSKLDDYIYVLVLKEISISLAKVEYSKKLKGIHSQLIKEVK